MLRPVTVEAPAELLAFMFAAWPDVKKKQVRQWLKFKVVTVNGRPISQFDHILRKGDVVAIRSDRYAVPKTVIGGGIEIRFEDESLVVIVKPADLLSIASEAEGERTAYFLLNEYLRANNPRETERVWIVHRLDRETSGLMVFAKTARAKEALQRRWDKAEKRYEAVVEGQLPATEGTFESYLDETNPYRVRSAPRGAQTRHAVTHFLVRRHDHSRSLVSLTLGTGRRHQIRVQLMDAGCPIIGDKKYGARSDPANRLGLHACELRFPHPVTGSEMHFVSPLPRELARLV